MNAAELPESVQLRTLATADLPAVLEIEGASFSTPWRLGTFQSLLQRPDTDLIAATLDDRLVGYAICWTILDQSELGNVAVAPGHRGHGVGRRLVAEALARVRARGASECYLEVRESNRPAQRLYERFGFQTVGRRRRYYSNPPEDALVMRAALCDPDAKQPR